MPSPQQPLKDGALMAQEYDRLLATYNELRQEHENLRERYSRISLKNQEAELEQRREASRRANEREELIMDKIDLRTALEELRAVQDEVLQKQEELERANAEITAQKARAEAAAQELTQKNEQLLVRAIELRTATEELKALQEEHLNNQRMLSLGNLIANIAHELNTPLGAIHAATQNLSHGIPTLLEQLPQVLGILPEAQQPMVRRLIEAAAQPRPELDVRGERQARNRLLDTLKAAGFPPYRQEPLARQLVKVNPELDVTPLLELLRDEASDRVVEAALAAGRTQVNLETLGTGIQKMQKTLLALKSYTDDELAQQKGATVDLAQNLAEAIDQYSHLAKHGIILQANLPDGLPQYNCFPDQLKQVWNHLLLNATQAVAAGGTIEVALHYDEAAMCYTASVQDSGQGIPQKDQERIFEAFYTTRPEGEGSGLGLFVSRKIVQKHGGSISVTSEPGNTLFQVRLPRYT